MPDKGHGAERWTHTGSVAIAALVYLAFQAIIGFGAIESWPLTHSPMFRNIPKESYRYRFEVEDASGRRLEVEPAAFAKMRRPQIRALIRRHLTSRDARNPEAFCDGMFGAYNTRKDPEDRLVRLDVFKDLQAPQGDGPPQAPEVTHIYTCLDGELAAGRPPTPDRSPPVPLTPAEAVRSSPFGVELDPSVLEAEHYTAYAAGTGAAAGAAWKIAPAAAGVQAVDCLPNVGVSTGDRLAGPRLDYSLEIGAAGTYYIWVRMLGRGGTDNSIHIGWDSRPLTLGGRGVSADSGVWEWVSRVARRGPELISVVVESPGPHTLHVWAREDGVAVDQILLTRERSYRPQGAETGVPPPPEVASAQTP